MYIVSIDTNTCDRLIHFIYKHNIGKNGGIIKLKIILQPKSSSYMSVVVEYKINNDEKKLKEESNRDMNNLYFYFILSLVSHISKIYGCNYKFFLYLMYEKRLERCNNNIITKQYLNLKANDATR